MDSLKEFKNWRIAICQSYANYEEHLNLSELRNHKIFIYVSKITILNPDFLPNFPVAVHLAS